MGATIEREVKILEINPKEVENKLINLGARLVFSGKISTIYYDFPDKRLYKRSAIVRVRKEGEKNFLDFKETLFSKDVKESKEIRLSIDSFENSLKLLEELGLVRVGEIKKFRRSYSLNSCKVEVEFIEGIPPFIEIEGPPEEIKKLISLLGLGKNKIVLFDSFELLSYYGKSISSKNSFS